jgi:hypothetical protein
LKKSKKKIKNDVIESNRVKKVIEEESEEKCVKKEKL